MSDVLQTALALAAKGKNVFPCWPGRKEPLTGAGFKDATMDKVTIRRWWAQDPGANLAIATGALSEVVVLDVDLDAQKGRDGEAALAALVQKHGALPQTLTVRTPRGGRHYYFKHPGFGIRVPCSSDKLGSGLDVRGDGGYVLVPPSRTECGEYHWESKHAPTDLPKWLFDLVIYSGPKGTDSTQKYPNGDGDEQDRIEDALRYIPPSMPHDDWVRVLMALHRWDPDRGKTLARDWSVKCAEKFREADFEAAWRSFKTNGGVGLGSLFEMARRHGWEPSRHRTVLRQREKSSANEVPDLVLAKWPDPPRPEAFYGVFGEFIRRIGPHTESDPMGLLIQLLVGFGNVLGRTAHFLVEADKHYPNLNAAIVGSSSKARKGTSWGHVNKLLRRVDSTWPRHLSGLSTGEGLIYHVRDATKKLKDGVEELVDAGVIDKRLLAVESEFGRTLQCSSREGNTLSAVVRQAFDTGDLRVATKGSPQTSTDAHISTIGHITVVELNILLTTNDTANGFANRFLWTAVRRSKLLPEGGNAAAVDMSDLVEQLKLAVEFAKTGSCISRDEGATELWCEIYKRLSEERPGLLGAVVSRAEALVMRLAMILAVTDCSPVIQQRHLLAALAIWDYCEASAAFIFGDSLGNPTAERVLQLLQDAGERGLSLTGIYDQFSGHLEQDELHAALKQLHSQGLAKSEKVRTAGRSSQVWFAMNARGEKSEESAKKVIGLPVTTTSSTQDLSLLNTLNSPEEVWEEII